MGKPPPRKICCIQLRSTMTVMVNLHVCTCIIVVGTLPKLHAPWPWTGQILFTPHSDGTMASLTPLPAQNRHNTVTDPHHPCAKEAVSGNSRKSCLHVFKTGSTVGRELLWLFPGFCYFF